MAEARFKPGSSQLQSPHPLHEAELQFLCSPASLQPVDCARHRELQRPHLHLVLRRRLSALQCDVDWGRVRQCRRQRRLASGKEKGVPFSWGLRMCKLLQSCLTLCNPVDCSPPGSSLHGILQARMLEWVAMPSSRGSSPPRDRTHVAFVSFVGSRFFTTSATWEAFHLGWS